MALLTIVDDHPIITDSVSQALSAMGHNVRSASTASELREHLAIEPGAAVILDIGLPDGNGIRLVSEITDWHQVPVIVFSGVSDPVTIHACVKNGARGYVPKSARATLLIDAITAVMEGRTSLPLEYLSSAVRQSEDVKELTKREIETLRWAQKGKTAAETGILMHLSERTIIHYREEARKKLAVAKLSQAIEAARAAGYLD